VHDVAFLELPLAVRRTQRRLAAQDDDRLLVPVMEVVLDRHVRIELPERDR